MINPHENPDNPNPRLAALENQTKATEAENPSHEDQQREQVEQEQASAADQAAKQWGMLMYTIGGFACMIAPELKPVYAEERCFTWGQQVNAVAEKYGWDGPSAMPELALIASTAGFALPTYFLVRDKLKQAETGSGPSTWWSKAGLWWRTRKARAAAKATPEPAEWAPDGSQ